MSAPHEHQNFVGNFNVTHAQDTVKKNEMGRVDERLADTSCFPEYQGVEKLWLSSSLRQVFPGNQNESLVF